MNTKSTSLAITGLIISVAAVAQLAGPQPRVGKFSPNTLVQVPGYENKSMANVYISTVCIDGYEYLMTERGGISPKIGTGGRYNNCTP